MRIISGALGGRELATGAGGARPAMGRTREALFSMLEARGIEWEGLRALDLYAGTGSLGFEALSRGAARADFVDNSPQLCAALRLNAEKLGILQNCGIFCEQARVFLGKRPASPYGLIFIDPPYRKKLVAPALAALAAHGFCAPEAFVCAELETGADPAVPACLESLISREYGQTKLEIWQKN